MADRNLLTDLARRDALHNDRKILFQAGILGPDTVTLEDPDLTDRRVTKLPTFSGRSGGPIVLNEVDIDRSAIEAAMKDLWDDRRQPFQYPKPEWVERSRMNERGEIEMVRVRRSRKGPPVIEASAKEIHTELLQGMDSDLERAWGILDGHAGALSRARKLRELGFSDQGEVQPHAREAELLCERAVEYAAQYPGLKFINEHRLNAICGKYGLVIGPVGRFRGEVPQWALDQIHKNRHLIKTHPVSNMEFVFDAVVGTRVMRSTSDGTNLRIAAPRATMEVHHNERVHGHRIVRVEDPIVFLEVEGGAIVLAAWGEEGQDPGVFNALHN